MAFEQFAQLPRSTRIRLAILTALLLGEIYLLNNERASELLEDSGADSHDASLSLRTIATPVRRDVQC